MMNGPLMSLLGLIVTLGVLITVHEFGHFWVARRLGVKVLRFSNGFGRPLWLRRGRDGVEYVVAALPLGGYVKMLDEREGEVPPAELPLAFNRQPVSSRIVIVLAGPLFNFLFAILVYSLMFMIGLPGIPKLGDPVPGSPAAAGGFREGDRVVAIDGKPNPTLSALRRILLDRTMAGEVIQVKVVDAEDQTRIRALDLRDAGELGAAMVSNRVVGLTPWRLALPAVIGQVTRGGAAERAGLQPGDLIVQAAGEPIVDWEQWRGLIQRHPSQSLKVRIKRDGVAQALELIPDAQETEGGKRIGFIGAIAEVPHDLAESLRAMVRYGPLDAVSAAVSETWDWSLFMLRVLGRMLVGRVSLDNLSGPVAIAQVAGQAASAGLMPFLEMLALVSISLGVLNLLPVPVLDGGHLLYYLIELAKGSPLSETVQNLGQRVGMVVLLLLMGLALFNDFSRLLG